MTAKTENAKTKNAKTENAETEKNSAKRRYHVRPPPTPPHSEYDTEGTNGAVLLCFERVACVADGKMATGGANKASNK